MSEIHAGATNKYENQGFQIPISLLISLITSPCVQGLLQTHIETLYLYALFYLLMTLQFDDYKVFFYMGVCYIHRSFDPDRSLLWYCIINPRGVCTHCLCFHLGHILVTCFCIFLPLVGSQQDVYSGKQHCFKISMCYY